MTARLPVAVALAIPVVVALAAGAEKPAQAPKVVEVGGKPIATTPALTPAEAQRKFVVPQGFEVRLFAAEPDVVNPVAMTWDERGRLWVVELFQYPHKASPGTKGRDRIKILEDTDNDGRADKVKVFAEGLDLATGIAIGRGGVFVAQAPELLFLEDTDGDDVADRRTVLLTGFSTEDTHETANGFVWGPDGWLYFTHGVFNDSKVKRPDAGEDETVPMTAAVARYSPERRKVEIFADGTSNPWGVDFDRTGNAFVSACVIDHFFHMAPGGVYVRQAGVPTDPYAYDLLPAIVDHKHFRAAYAGVQIYQGDQYPAEYQGTALMGNIHGNSINRDRLEPVGASFAAREEKDFLATPDGWFRPVSELVGPDGNVWVADWYDRYPCYQNAKADPEGVDRAYGRIWRVVYTGDRPGAPRPSVRPGTGDLARRPSRELVALLDDRNVWHRRTAQRVLSERRDAAAREDLRALLGRGRTLEGRLAALWTLHGAGLLDEGTLDAAAQDRDPALRAWAARLTGERDDTDRAGALAPGGLARLARLARDADPTVRAGVAAAARRMSGRDTSAVLTALAEGPGTADDRTLAFLVWRAVEPRVARDAGPILTWLEQRGEAALPYAALLARRTLRRLYDTGEPARLAQALEFLGRIGDRSPALVAGAVEGLREAQRGQTLRPARDGLAVIRRLTARAEAEVSRPALRLGAAWGDPAAVRRIVAAVADARAPTAERIAALEVAAQIPGPAARRALLGAATGDAPPAVTTAAIRALGTAGSPEAGGALVSAWKRLGPEARATALEVLASRPAWARALAAGVRRKVIAPGDVPLPVRRKLARLPDPAARADIEAVLGRYRESERNLEQAVAEKKLMVLAGPVDFEDGRVQAQRTCLLCHKFFGEGTSEVGPDLTGVGRSSLDTLLANVIDPNQVIGKGYEQVTVTTRDGRVVSGRLVEDTPAKVTLIGLNLRETIPRAQVKSIEVGDVSVMPEGLDQLPDEQFRNLIWYVFQPPQDPNPQLRLELRDKRLVVLRREGQGWSELLQYVMDPALRPYIHPLRDPSGKLVLTDDRPSDHVWQHGVFTGLHKVGGVDFWTERQGKQRFVRLLDAQHLNDRVSWRALTEWVTPEGKIALVEEQSITVYAPSPDGYSLDFVWTLQAPRHDHVEIGRHDYGGLSVRMPLDPRHTHLNSEGDRHKQAANKRARWTTVERPFGDEVWGVAVLDHPGNERHPAAWRVDGQGLISPSPSLQGAWSIPANRRKSFQYRVVVYRGPAQAARLEKEFRAFAETSFLAAGGGR